MKLVLLKPQRWTCSFHSGFLIFVMCFFLASASLAQAADARIAFMSTRNSDNGEIFLMNPDGKRVRQLTRHLQYDAVPAWSPDGKKITFMSFRDEHKLPGSGAVNGDIYVMNSDGTNPINLTQAPGRHDLDSCWSPDGKQIVFTSFKGFLPDIWVMDADGTNQRKLTDHEAGERDPDWSPDGTRIAFYSNRDGIWDRNPNDNWEIYVMDADGQNPINLTNNPAWDSHPAWSPDGTQIAFDSNREGNTEVYVMNADGTNLINLTNHPAADRTPDWSPDGTRIVFESNRDGNWEIKPKDNWEVYVMNADGTNPINLTNHRKWDSQPTWEPVPTLSVAPNGRLTILWGKVKRSNIYGVK